MEYLLYRSATGFGKIVLIEEDGNHYALDVLQGLGRAL